MGTQLFLFAFLAIIGLVTYVTWSIKYHSKKEATGEFKSFGFSYIGIARVIIALISLAVGVLSMVVVFNFNGGYLDIAIAIGIPVVLLMYYLLNFSIIKFRNNAIIAKTNTEILQQLIKLNAVKEEENGKKN